MSMPRLLNAQRHDIADVFRLGDHLRTDKRFINMIDPRWIRHFRRVVHRDHLTLTGSRNKAYVWNRGDYRLVKFPFKPLLYDLHMQHAQKSATEAEAKRLRMFRVRRLRKHHSVAIYPCNPAVLQTHRSLPGICPRIPSASRLQIP